MKCVVLENVHTPSPTPRFRFPSFVGSTVKNSISSMLALPLLNSKLVQEPQIIYENEQKKLIGLILCFIIIFYLFCCFVLYKTVHSPLFSRKMVEIARFELRTAIQHQCQNYLGGRGGLGGSEKNRRTVITSLQLAFRRRNRNFTPFTIH